MDDNETYLAVFAIAAGNLLEPDEGIIIHFEEQVYIVWLDSSQDLVKIESDDAYAQIENGTKVWMHYEGSTAPDPEEVPGAEVIALGQNKVNKKKLH